MLVTRLTACGSGIAMQCSPDGAKAIASLFTSLTIRTKDGQAPAGLRYWQDGSPNNPKTTSPWRLFHYVVSKAHPQNGVLDIPTALFASIFSGALISSFAGKEKLWGDNFGSVDDPATGKPIAVEEYNPEQQTALTFTLFTCSVAQCLGELGIDEPDDLIQDAIDAMMGWSLCPPLLYQRDLRDAFLRDCPTRMDKVKWLRALPKLLTPDGRCFRSFINRNRQLISTEGIESLDSVNHGSGVGDNGHNW